MRVAEHAQQDAFPLRLVAGGLAEPAQDLAGVVAQPELEQAVAELLAVRPAAYADAIDLEDLTECDADRSTLRRRQLFAQPPQDRLVARRVGVELEGLASTGDTLRTRPDRPEPTLGVQNGVQI
jgi:hypothetical protein